MTWTFSSARHVDAPKGDAPRGSDGLTGCATYNERTRDRMQAAEAMKPEALRPKTETEQAGDYYYALHLQREAERKAREHDVEQTRLAKRHEQEAVAALKKKLVDECGFTPDTAERRARELRRK